MHDAILVVLSATLIAASMFTLFVLMLADLFVLLFSALI